MTNLNKQPADLKSHSIEFLRLIKSGMPVVSSDHVEIGTAVRLHRRINGVKPELKLYHYYLECIRPQMGNTGFIPTDFIAELNIQTQKILLTVNASAINEERWDVTPPFISYHENEAIHLE